MLHELERAHDLLLDLVVAAEDVGVVLAEPPHPRKTRQRSAQLIIISIVRRQQRRWKDRERQLEREIKQQTSRRVKEQTKRTVLLVDEAELL